MKSKFSLGIMSQRLEIHAISMPSVRTLTDIPCFHRAIATPGVLRAGRLASVLVHLALR